MRSAAAQAAAPPVRAADAPARARRPLRALVERAVVVVGHGAERVTKTLQEYGPPDLMLDFVEQRVTRGTGDALVRGPDRPPRRPRPRRRRHRRPARRHAPRASLHPRRAGRSSTGRATPRPPSSPPASPIPAGMGRVSGARTAGWHASSSDADATEAERDIDEVAPRSTASDAACSPPPCAGISPENAQGEYYLTDVVAVLHGAGHKVVALVADDPSEAVGVNDRAQLARGRGRAAAPHQRALDAGRRHHGRPRTHLRRRRRAPGGRRHPVPGHHPPGPHRRRAGRRDRARTPAWSTAWWAKGRSWSRRSGYDAEIGGGQHRGAVRRPRGPGRISPPGASTGAVLHCTGRR